MMTPASALESGAILNSEGICTGLALALTPTTLAPAFRRVVGAVALRRHDVDEEIQVVLLERVDLRADHLLGAAILVRATIALLHPSQARTCL